MEISAGVIVSDKKSILGCIPYGKNPRAPNTLDLPKGHVEGQETAIEAAIREIREETGMVLQKTDLKDLGEFKYIPNKNLHLFLYLTKHLPDLKMLRCSSKFDTGKPEMVGYEYVSINDISSRFYTNLAKVIILALGAPRGSISWKEILDASNRGSQRPLDV